MMGPFDSDRMDYLLNEIIFVAEKWVELYGCSRRFPKRCYL